MSATGKIWTAVLLFNALLIGSIMVATAAKPTTKEEPLVYHVDAKWMLKFYGAINDNYYEGKLPPISFEFVKDLKDYWGNPVMASTSRQAPFHMKMDARLKDMPPVAIETLYHETCHVELESTNRVDPLDDHGPNFQACMLDKAERGAFRDIW